MLLTTGRTLYANRGVLGLSTDRHDPSLYEGFDGFLDRPDHYEGEEGNTRLTPLERREVADRMIARWHAWAEGR